VNSAPAHWFYPVNSASGYFLWRGRTTHVPVTPDSVWEDVQAEHPNSTSWPLASGYRIMQPDDVIWIYATIPHQFLCAASRVVGVFWDEQDGAHKAEMMWDLDLSRALHDNPLTREQFGGQHIQSVQRAKPPAAVVLDDWLAARRLAPRTPDDPRGPGSEAEARAWTLRQVRQRQGQGRFRAQLLQHYRGQCAVTDEPCLDVLEAAHIEPFATSEDHAVTNGILLRSDLHTLFDLHLIGVDAKGALVVSPQVTSPTYRALDGTKLAVPKSKLARPSPPALAEHLAGLVSDVS